MLSEGNSRPEICTSNLLRTVRGEVPYERIKGLPREIIDRSDATLLLSEAKWTIEIYEPRVDVEKLTVDQADWRLGQHSLNVNILVGGQ